MNPIMLLLAMGKGGLGKGGGMIKKILMYTMLGPIGMILGGKFNVMDFLLIPQIAPMFSGMFGSLTGGTAKPAGAGLFG